MIGAAVVAPSGWLRAAPIGIVLVLASIELLRTAWICDDAAITLRVILNLLHGFGPNFNVDERVQAYTHPLWFFGLSGLSFVLGDVFRATHALGIASSLLALWTLAARASAGLLVGCLGAMTLLLSKAWVDYSTSGLENPLAHGLLLLTIVLGSRAIDSRSPRELLRCLALCGLLYLTRPDLLLLVGPFAGWVLWRVRPPAMIAAPVLAIAALPVFAWTLFSLWYYGFPFPNTAYAKLANGIPLDELVAQGLHYASDSLSRDPLTLLVTLAGTVVGMWYSAATRALSIGILAYLCFVISIGGDFMSGRFFTVVLVSAVAILVRVPAAPLHVLVAAALVALVGGTNLKATLLSGSSYQERGWNEHGIADERGYHFQQPGSGLLNEAREAFALPPWTLGERSVAVVCGGLGFYALSAGPSRHVIDTCGLADPLTARLPPAYREKWRIGHFYRQLPTDYVHSVARNENLLADDEMRAYYEAIRRVTRAPLSDPSRWRDIVRLNLGRVPLPDLDVYRFQTVPRASHVPEIVAARLAEGSTTEEFVDRVDVVLPGAVPIRALEIALGGNDDYLIAFHDGRDFRPLRRIGRQGGEAAVLHQIRFGKPTPPVSRLRIFGLAGDGIYTLAELRVNPEP